MRAIVSRCAVIMLAPYIQPFGFVLGVYSSDEEAIGCGVMFLYDIVEVSDR